MSQIAEELVVAFVLVSTAAALAADYTAPLTPQQEDFKARFMARDAICREKAMHDFNLSMERAEAFCVCEIDVIARNSSIKELGVFTAAATGTDDQQGESRARADDIMSRLLPERKRVCGN